MKVQREKGLVIRLQFYIKHVIRGGLNIVLISHYQLEQIESVPKICKNSFHKLIYLDKASQTKQSLKEFQVLCEIIIPAMRLVFKVKAEKALRPQSQRLRQLSPPSQ